MKAAAFQKQNEVGVIDAPVPKAGAGEVVLKVHNCGICGSDLHAVQFGTLRPGCIMGHEFCGEVHEVGAGVRGFEVGQRVASLPWITCGECDACARGEGYHCRRNRVLGLGQLPGGYAEFVACGERSLLKLPDNVSSREGALVEPLSVGLHGVNRANIKPGVGCVVMGAGPIGLATLTWCKAKGANPIIVSELAAGRAELALRLGATEVVNPTEKKPADRMRELTGRSPELVIECIGVKGTLAAAVDIAGTKGRVVVVGACMEPDTIMPLRCLAKEVSIEFAIGYTKAEFQETIDAFANGSLDAKPMITDVIGIEEVPAMFEALRKPGNRAKVMVEFPR
ncbi:MAG TPA: alcohol dehydrogenase catalytic domain-containing protein [Candidatus Binataceae bacterium]|nr:alcohol dehydrogenase catalytic domain-containing protein [Candidatus Binataceae bacterium]